MCRQSIRVAQTNVLSLVASIYDWLMVAWIRPLIRYAFCQLEVRIALEDELLLLHRAQALDAEALEEVHNRYYASIYRYVIVRVNDTQLAEDITSEVFIRFLSALRDKTAPKKTIRGWLFTVASRVVKDHYRKKYRHPETELDEQLVSTMGNPTSALTQKLSKESLRTAITQLTEDQQNVIALRFGYEMSIKETADTMNKSIGSIKMLQARAVAALARLMGKDEATNE